MRENVSISSRELNMFDRLLLPVSFNNLYAEIYIECGYCIARSLARGLWVGPGVGLDLF